MENKNIAILLAAFVMIIIGVALIGTTASEVLKRTDTTAVASETLSIAAARNITDGSHLLPYVNLTLANAPLGKWQEGETGCAIANFVLKNSSGATRTVTTDYTITAAKGYVRVNDVPGLNETSSNSTTVSYEYCADDYLNASWTRSVLNLVPGFFAIALLLIGVGLAYSILKSEGIDKL